MIEVHAFHGKSVNAAFLILQDPRLQGFIVVITTIHQLTNHNHYGLQAYENHCRIHLTISFCNGHLVKDDKVLLPWDEILFISARPLYPTILV